MPVQATKGHHRSKTRQIQGLADKYLVSNFLDIGSSFFVLTSFGAVIAVYLFFKRTENLDFNFSWGTTSSTFFFQKFSNFLVITSPSIMVAARS